MFLLSEGQTSKPGDLLNVNDFPQIGLSRTKSIFIFFFKLWAFSWLKWLMVVWPLRISSLCPARFSPSSYICHEVGPLVDPFRSHVSRSLFNGLPCFLLQLGNSVSLPWVIYYEIFYLHVVSSFSCIPAICPKLLLFLTPSQFVYLFCNLSKCILLLFSCISSLLLLFFWRLLL